MSINEFAEHKGLIYEQFYLTRQGLPVLCCFVKFINNTGGYKDIGYDMQTFISGKENLTDIHAKTKAWDKDEYKYRMGDVWADSDRFVRISYEGKSARDEKLYVFNDSGRNNGGLGISSDINSCSVWTNAGTNLLNNTDRTMRPVFFMLTEKELTPDSVKDLDRITF